MNKEISKVYSLITSCLNSKNKFFFWLFVRLVSALFPLLTLYLFSRVIYLLEINTSLQPLILIIILIALTRLLDNFTRLKSIYKLEDIISDTSFNLHNYFINDLKSESKTERHESIQAIRNFTDATILTLRLLRQPGVDSLVSLIIIPIIIFVLDPSLFIIEIAYILIYLVTDFYTTQHYIRLKDIQNAKTEQYYAKLQDDNDIDLEQKSYSRHFYRLTHWCFIEWFSLQNLSIFFYCLSLVYLIFTVTQHQKQISDIVLFMGYLIQTQTFLNSLSEIHDGLADTSVALEHLAKNRSISAIDLSDLT